MDPSLAETADGPSSAADEEAPSAEILAISAERASATYATGAFIDVTDDPAVHELEPNEGADATLLPAAPGRRTPPPLPAEAAAPSASPAAAGPTPEAARVAPAASPRRRPTVAALLIAALVAANVGVVAGLLHTRSEGRSAVAPIAAIVADVKDLKTGQAAIRTELTETRATLDETRSTLAKQETVLLGTVEAVNQNAARQKEAERELKELEAREARDVNALASRIRLAEKRAADGSYSLTLGEAVKLIDAVEGSSKRGAPGVGDKAARPRAKPEK